MRRLSLLPSPLPPRDAWPWGAWLAQVDDLAEARALLGPAGQGAREARSALYWHSRQLRSRARLRLGMHDRGEEYLFADGRLCPEDAAGHRRHLPLHLKAIRLEELRLGPGEILDVSATSDDWPELDSREELYLWLRVDTLVLESGSAIMVRGNVCALEFGTIRFEGEAVEKNPEILIGGTGHAPYSAVRRQPALAGASGLKGTEGPDGVAARVHASAFGPRADPAGGPCDGGDGGNGANGGDGSHGQSGGMAMLADIRIGRLDRFGPARLTIRGEAGAGAPGGAGGDGGQGGRGGDGADGFLDAALTLPAGTGGDGGDGGDGGRGGHGGHGGLSSNIFVTVPAEDASSLDLLSVPSLGGASGRGGAGARGGRAGAGGRTRATLAVDGQAPAQAADGRPGTHGSRGSDGRAGRAREGPPIWLLTT